MAVKLQQIIAVPINEKFRRDSFCIMSAKQQQPVDKSEPQTFSILGEAEQGELKSHLPYYFWGRWESKNGYRPISFRFDSFSPIEPHNQAGIVTYLRQARHVGPATAHALWDAFEGEAVNVLREEPERAAEAISLKRFSPERAREAAEDLDRLKVAEDLTIQLYDLFDGRGFGKACVRQALKLWGAEAVKILTRDPYRAMALRGVGFLKADKFYLDLGKPPGKLKRQAYSVTYAVNRESDQHGHVWVPVEVGVEFLKASIGGADVSPEKALTLAVRGGILRRRRESGRLWLADVRRAGAEELCCRMIAEAMTEADASTSAGVPWPTTDRPEFRELTDHQRAELAKATAGRIGILGGRPGTGKSFTLVRLVRAVLATKGHIAVIAPTGKASQRVKELMQEAGLSGVRPTTIHSGLGVHAVDEGGWRFSHNELNPLPCRYLIIEEASMLGTGLLKSVLAARAKGCSVLFVGDVNQLPPVEYGAPLRDMIEAGIPYGELKEIHRNAGTIVRVCSAIVNRQPWEPDNKIDMQAEQPKNLVLYACTARVAPTRVCELLEQLRDSPYDPVWDVQVIVAVNQRSPLSRTALNQRLQALLNPTVTETGSPFRLDDKVIQLRNQFIPLAVQSRGEWTSADDKVLIANGEIGRVLHVEEKKTVVQFPSSQKPVIIFRAGQMEDTNENGNGEEKTNTGCDLDLAYAVTCHKMQGSESPIVIVCIDEYSGATGQYGVCDRAWLYTAISRAQKACFLVGMKSTADVMCRRTFISRRKTFMAEEIRREAASVGLVLKVNESDAW